MKKLCVLVSVMLLTVGASAFGVVEMVSNGGFDNGLTDWDNYTFGYPPIGTPGGPLSVTVKADGLPDPAAYWEHDGTQYGQAGFYQLIPVNIGEPLRIQWDWKGDTDLLDVGGYGWAEFYAHSWDGVSVINGWSGTLLATKSGENFAWDWEHGDVWYTPTSELLVVILGGGVIAGPAYIAYDNVSVIPEPATMILVGLGGLGALLRKRR